MSAARPGQQGVDVFSVIAGTFRPFEIDLCSKYYVIRVMSDLHQTL